jgi:hypothetical protein
MTDSVISFGFEPNREDAITPRDVDWSTSNYRRHAPFPCPITSYPCEGDLSHLCEEYGCARKGGLSPRSNENLLRRSYSITVIELPR